MISGCAACTGGGSTRGGRFSTVLKWFLHSLSWSSSLVSMAPLQFRVDRSVFLRLPLRRRVMSYTVLESPLLAASCASCTKLSANSRLSLLQLFLTSLSFWEYSFCVSLFCALVLALFRLSLSCRLSSISCHVRADHPR